MYRSLRDILGMISVVMLTCIAVCHMDIPECSRADRHAAAVPEEFVQDYFSPASSSPENFMEQTLGSGVTLPASTDSPRSHTTAPVKAAAAMSLLSSSASTAAYLKGERPCGISRLNDYYVFGLGHIII